MPNNNNNSNNESLVHLTGRPIACPPRSLTPPPLVKSPPDSIIYGGFGKNWTLQKYRKYTEDLGFEWTSALHHQVLVSENFMRDHLGYGYTDEEVTKRYTTSGIGYDCPPTFMVAFKRCEADYFYAEILDLAAKKCSLPKLLDVLKGGKTSGGFFVHDKQLADGRRAIRRLLAADVSDNALRHRIKKLSPERNWEVEKHLATPYNRGFLQDLDETAKYGDLEWCRLNAAYAPKEMIEKSLTGLGHFRSTEELTSSHPVPSPTIQSLIPNPMAHRVLTMASPDDITPLDGTLFARTPAAIHSSVMGTHTSQIAAAEPMYNNFETTTPISEFPAYFHPMSTEGQLFSTTTQRSVEDNPISGNMSGTSYGTGSTLYDNMETQ